MKSILQALYDGKLYPAEQYAPKSKEYQTISHEYSRHCHDFSDALAELDPPMANQFEKILEEQNETMSYELSEMFIDGFRLGARIMIDVFHGELYREKIEVSS